MSSIEKIWEVADARSRELARVSDFIWDHPEPGFQEYECARYLVNYLQGKGFTVTTGTAGYKTAFRAEHGHKTAGPTIAFPAEYDALPGIGHACGHNLIAAVMVGTATVMAEAWPDHPGRLVVVGCPGEDLFCGTLPDGDGERGIKPSKIAMAEQGVFDDVDVVLQFHGVDRTYSGRGMLACDALEFTFRGTLSHASIAPDEGASAMDAAMLATFAIEMLREHVPQETRIHSSLRDGWRAVNVVPDVAVLKCLVKASTRTDVEKIVPRVIKCAEAAALATGTSVHVETVAQYQNRVVVHTLSDLLVQYATAAGATQVLPPLPGGRRDLDDSGMITYRVPTGQLMCEFMPVGSFLHSRVALKYAREEPGHRAVILGVKALGATAYCVMSEPQLLGTIRREFEQAVRQGGFGT